MAQPTQLGKPVSVAFTPDGGSVMTITDILEAPVKPSSALHPHKGGTNRNPFLTIGDDETTITFKTTDITVPAAIRQGMLVSDVTVTYEGVRRTINIAGVSTPVNGTYTFSCTMAYVAEPIEIPPAIDGKPAEFTVVLKGHQEDDGTDPTYDLTFTPGGGGS